jgi:hypothetical protein
MENLRGHVAAAEPYTGEWPTTTAMVMHFGLSYNGAR